ncbi:hypothetical protein V3C99_013562 [Haemonchus contortus]
MARRSRSEDVRKSRSSPSKVVRKKKVNVDGDEDSRESLTARKVTALMNAARSADDDAIIKLFLEALDLSFADGDGNTALHLAAKNGHQSTCRILIVLASPLRLWEIENDAGLIAEEVATNDKIVQDLRYLREGEKRREVEYTRWNDELIANTTEWKPNGKVLLALDGGGVKSLVLTQILLYLEDELNGNFLPRIDWIAGTSSGGVTALMLCHGESLIDARRFFIKNRFRVFCGNKAKVPKHDSRGIEDTAKKLFGTGHMGSFSKDKPKVMVTVSDTRRSPANLVLFRSFSPQIPKSLRKQLDYLDPEKILIWKAARCTSAAPYYFDSYNGLSDGGLVANNPTQALIADFLQTTRLEKEYSSSEKTGPDPCMACVISIGTGSCPAEDTEGIDMNFNFFATNKKSPIQLARGFFSVVRNAKNMLQILVRECTSSSGQPVRYSREWCHSLNVPFFRFSPMMRTAVQLDNTERDVIMQMLWETECYIRGEGKYELQQLARFLEMKPLSGKNEWERSHGLDERADMELATAAGTDLIDRLGLDN